MAERRNTRLSGHALWNEGRAFTQAPGGRLNFADTRTGIGVCECGEASPVLTSDSARKRWHAEHKANVGR